MTHVTCPEPGCSFEATKKNKLKAQQSLRLHHRRAHPDAKAPTRLDLLHDPLPVLQKHLRKLEAADLNSAPAPSIAIAQCPHCGYDIAEHAKRQLIFEAIATNSQLEAQVVKLLRKHQI